MRIYLDMCCLQRPLDDQTYLRIHIEAEAVLGILTCCKTKNVELLNSVALQYELAHNPYPLRKTFVQEALSNSKEIITATCSVETLACSYNAKGIKNLDALHLACAVDAQANYFCTCDDRLFRLAKQANTKHTRVVSILELIEILEL